MSRISRSGAHRYRRSSASAALVAAVTFAAFTIGSPAAHAAGDTIQGGCFAFTLAHRVLTNGQNQGIIGDRSSTSDSNGPEDATVECRIRVNGVVDPNTDHFYSGGSSQSGYDQIYFSAHPEDTVELCQNVYYSNLFYGSGETCQNAERLFLPGPAVDSNLCPVLKLLAGNYGPLTIGSDGDLTIDLLSQIYDCPPYY